MKVPELSRKSELGACTSEKELSRAKSNYTSSWDVTRVHGTDVSAVSLLT